MLRRLRNRNLSMLVQTIIEQHHKVMSRRLSVLMILAVH